MELSSVKVGIRVVCTGIIIPAMIRKYSTPEALNFIFAKAKEIIEELKRIKNTLATDTSALFTKYRRKLGWNTAS